MLVLTRRVGETVAIAEGMITVTVKSVSGDSVKLAFEAPRDIPVMRMELQLRRDAEREGARD